MLSPHPPANHELLYEADARPSLPLTIGMVLMPIPVSIAPIVLGKL